MTHAFANRVGDLPVKTFQGYRCEICGKLLFDEDDANSHCRKHHPAEVQNK